MINLQDYGLEKALLPENPIGIPARITAVHKERYELICMHGILYGKLKTSVYYGTSSEEFPVVGDFVLMTYIENGDSQIIKTLPRKTFFSRRDPFPGQGEQAITANFDTVFIMASLNHDFNLKRLERYLTLAWQSGAAPIILLTKSDLAEDIDTFIHSVQEIAPNIEIFAISTKSGYGLEQLSPYLQPAKTIVFLGSSGVGKSSLVNALMGEDTMAVSAIREDDSRGRHTTTHRQLTMLPSGAMLIDTPGMRTLGMWDVSTGLGEAFRDIENLLSQCRFADCNHGKEPGCAIKQAIEDGELSPKRWKSYLNLKREAEYTDNRTSTRKRETWHKTIRKNTKQNKKPRTKQFDEF